MFRTLALALVLAGPALAQDVEALMAESLGANPLASYWRPDNPDPAAATEAIGVEYIEIEGAAGNFKIFPGYFQKGGDGFAFIGEVTELYGSEPRDPGFLGDRIELTTTMPKPDDPRCCPTGSPLVVDRKSPRRETDRVARAAINGPRRRSPRNEPRPRARQLRAEQMLTADDFRAEQAYHRGRLALLLRSVFGPGTIAGLRVSADKSSLDVEPGLALDALGRLIEVRTAACLDLARWRSDAGSSLQFGVRRTDPSVVVADLLLSADTSPARPVTAPDGSVPTRLAEGGRLTLVASVAAPPPHWPSADAPRAERLEAVLSAWGPDPDPNSGLLIARISIPVDPDVPAVVDNAVRPFIFLPRD